MVNLQGLIRRLVPRCFRTDGARKFWIILSLFMELFVLFFYGDTFVNLASFVNRPEYETLTIEDSFGGSHTTVVEKGIEKDCGEFDEANANDIIDFLNGYPTGLGMFFFGILLLIINAGIGVNLFLKVKLLINDIKVDFQDKALKIIISSVLSVLEFSLPPLCYPVFTIYCGECLEFNKSFTFLYSVVFYYSSFIGFFVVAINVFSNWRCYKFVKKNKILKALCWAMILYYTICALVLTFMSFTDFQLVYFTSDLFAKTFDFVFSVDIIAVDEEFVEDKVSVDIGGQ